MMEYDAAHAEKQLLRRIFWYRTRRFIRRLALVIGVGVLVGAVVGGAAAVVYVLMR